MLLRQKKVPWRQLKIDQEISGVDFEENGRAVHHGFTGYVKSRNAYEVKIAKWEPTNPNLTAYPSTNSKFIVDQTDAEFRRNNNNRAKTAVQALKNHMSYDEIGDHEMANGWLEWDPWNLAANLRQYKYTILGVCPDIIPKTSISGDILDIGVCAEDEDHDRFWCHFRSRDVKIIIGLHERYEAAPDKRNFDENKAHWEILKELDHHTD